MKASRHKSASASRKNDQTAHLDDCQPIIRAHQSGELNISAWSHGHYPGQQIPKNTLFGLNSVGIWDAHREQSWSTKMHCNEGIELTYIENGQVSLETEDWSHMLVSNDLAITLPGQAHRLGAPHVGPTRVYWFILDVGANCDTESWNWPSWILLTPDDQKEFAYLLSNCEKPVWCSDAELQQCFQQMGKALETENYEAEISLMAVLINYIFVRLLRLMKQEASAEKQSPIESSQYVTMFWQEVTTNSKKLTQEWTLAEMASHCGLGVTLFCHITKRLFNLTPSRYLQQCRLEYAANLLLQKPEMRITDIALSSGFGSGQYFSRQFKQQFCCTPQVFRRGRVSKS